MGSQLSVSADLIAAQLTPSLKQRGFRKRRLTWCKELDDVTVLFQIQRSQWSKEDWYYLFGICIHGFTKLPVTSCNQNHIQIRCDCRYAGTLLTPEQVLELIDAWKERYGSIPLLCQHLAAGTIPLHSLVCDGYNALCALSATANIPVEKRCPDYWFSDIDFASTVLDGYKRRNCLVRWM